jgi:fucose 4-O-acetylase-like acetyltransferase
MRLRNIDLFKGLLILLVILGHTIQGKSEDVFPKYIIYTFHMPLFIGISGFLFNYKEAVNSNLITLVSKYFNRLIIPWIIATIAYFVFNQYFGDSLELTISVVFKSIIIPYTHLWFIPAFLSWVFMTWFFIKLKVPPKGIFAISVLISTISYLLFKNTYNIEGVPPMNSFTTTVFGVFRPYFYSFFVLGYVLKQTDYYKQVIEKTEIIYILILFALIMIEYFFDNNILLFVAFYLFNYLLLNKVLKICGASLLGSNKTLEWLGQNSLGIYLWHLFPILIADEIVGTSNLLIFYATAVSLSLIFLLLFSQLTKVKVINQYFFGMIKK